MPAAAVTGLHTGTGCAKSSSPSAEQSLREALPRGFLDLRSVLGVGVGAPASDVRAGALRLYCSRRLLTPELVETDGSSVEASEVARLESRTPAASSSNFRLSARTPPAGRGCLKRGAGCRLSGCRLSGCCLFGCCLSGCCLLGCCFLGCCLLGCSCLGLCSTSSSV